jgi:chromosome segregation ATPase
MSKNQIIIALVVLCLLGTIWGSVKDKKSENLERQLAAMNAQTSTASVATETTVNAAVSTAASEATAKALAEVKNLKSQNKKLLEKAATLNGTLTAQKEELAAMKTKLTEVDDGSQAVEAMQAKLDDKTSAITALEEAVAAGKAELDKKNVELAAAEEATAGLEDVKATLANNVDEYNAKSQELAAEVEEYSLRVQSLTNALEERTKLLVEAGEELARTKLNMNVLLSKIAAQNNSLAILEETRVALEQELASKFLTIEALQNQLGIEVSEEVVVVEEEAALAPEEAAPAPELTPAEETPAD